VASAEFLIGLLLAIALLAGLAELIDVPYPIVLVLGGAALGFLPGAPHVRLDPELVFFVFLPPLLYSAAFLSSAAELRANARPIFLLAVGRVVVTMVAVAAGAHVAIGLAWPLGFVLGAILAPTDPIAATSILRRLGAPRRIALILEGDSLVNDGTGLVLYKIALASVGAAAFSLPLAIGDFVLVVVGGTAIGLAVGWLSAWVRRSLDESRIEITVSLLTPFAAYIPAVRLGLSGVLAVVAAGLYVGQQSMAIFSAETRLRYYAFWEVLAFLLNAVLFLLVGLQLRGIVDGIGSTGSLVVDGVLISGVVLGVRIAWMFGIAPLLDRLPGAPIARSWRERLVLGWSGMRGALSLAAALALPLTAGGAPFPDRDELIFVTFVVILVTLVLPGLTLPSLITRLGLGEEDGRPDPGLASRAEIARAALARLDELAAGADGDGPAAEVADLQAVYEARLRRLELALGGDQGAVAQAEPDAYRRARAEVLATERAALARLRRDGLPDEIAREIERELDLDEARATREPPLASPLAASVDARRAGAR
jgi:CPA1 family monovalent cation:H+ antiporter